MAVKVYTYTCPKCRWEVDISPEDAESRYFIWCPACHHHYDTGFKPPPYVRRYEPGSREEVAEELVSCEKNIAKLKIELFAELRYDNGVSDEDFERAHQMIKEAQARLQRAHEKAAELERKGFPLTPSELEQAKRRIADRRWRVPRGIPRKDSRMPCPQCNASVFTDSAYCLYCGYALFKKGNLPMVFLCHSGRDKSFVIGLADELRKDGIDVWLDEWDIEVGDPIHKKIEEGIKNSDYFVIILSPNSVESDWVDKELRAAFTEASERGKKFILPVLIEDCSIPLFLRDTLYADCRGDNYDKGLEKLKKAIRRT